MSGERKPFGEEWGIRVYAAARIRVEPETRVRIEHAHYDYGTNSLVVRYGDGDALTIPVAEIDR